MISSKIVQTILQPRGLEDREAQVYEARDKFSLHLGYELKVQLEKGDVIRFQDDTVLVLNRDNQEIQHAVPLQSVIYLSVP